jgi:hypothetical protein
LQPTCTNKSYYNLSSSSPPIENAHLPAEYEEKVREEDPNLLQCDENIVLAFKGRGGSGRDHYMLTTTRVILRDKRGVTGKRVRYTSVPYTSIRAFSLETAGSVDTDQELKIHAVSII